MIKLFSFKTTTDNHKTIFSKFYFTTTKFQIIISKLHYKWKFHNFRFPTTDLQMETTKLHIFNMLLKKLLSVQHHTNQKVLYQIKLSSVF